MFTPPGYISLREAVVQLAEARAPEADVRGYLAKKPAEHETLLGKSRQFASKWDSYLHDDPFEWPPRDAKAPRAAWDALEAARGELWELLSQSKQQAVIVVQDRELTELYAVRLGEIAPVRAAWWRTPPGYSRLRHCSGRSELFLKEDRFVRWLTSQIQTEGSPIPGRKLNSWWRDHVQQHQKAGTIPTREQSRAAAIAEFPDHAPPTYEKMRDLRRTPPTPTSWTAKGRRPAIKRDGK